MNDKSRDQMRMDRDAEQGYVSIAAYLMVAVVGVFAIAIFARLHNFLQANERNQNRVTAFHMAEAAQDYAIKQLESDENYTGTSYTALNSSTTQGGYSISVTTPNDNPEVRLIQTTGFAPGNDASARAYETRSVTSYVQFKTQNYFDFAVFAKESLFINGNPVIDSYNSNQGAYGGSNTASNGDIGTDGASAGVVNLVGNALVKGDVAVGPGATLSTAITTSGGASYTGVADVSDTLRNDQAVTSTIASSGPINLSGQASLTLGSGTYRYSSIKLAGQAQITVTGSVTLYVDGDIDLSGQGIINSTTAPKNLLIFSSGSDVKLSGQADFHGAIHAPNASVRNVGNAVLYGAVLGKTYQQSGNGAVHYDEALKDVGGSGNQGVKLLAWKENSTSAWDNGSS